ncbi:MAG: TPM domain-containing protein [Patescibacteria group bacterium]|nr:TPM domain-containing protein [Patescibacteria group bacterium]
MFIKAIKNVVVLVLLFFAAMPALAYYNPGTPVGFVNDYAGMMSESERQGLETKLVNFESQTSNEISVVTIPNLDGDTIENFAVKLFEDWKIGKAKNDNGILVLVAKEDRQMRIEVGYGLEGALTDAQSFWIIDDIMKPAFRQEKYYEGIDQAIDKIIAATQGEYVPESKPAKGLSSNAWENIFWFGLFAIIWMASILGRSKSWWAGGIVGAAIGVIIGIIKGFVIFGLVALTILIPFGLLFDFIVSKNYTKHKASGTIPWWIGGGRGGGGFGGGGFGGGGFGGFGGGSSGGGGASGSW